MGRSISGKLTQVSRALAGDSLNLAMFVRICIIVTVCGLSAGGLLRPLQDFLGDQRFAYAVHRPTDKLLLVDIDEESIRRVGAWPWSRTVHALLLDKLRTLGAADIAFDVDFNSPSTPDGDAALEAALRRADGSVILAALQQAPRSGSDGRAALIQSRPLPRFAAQSWEGSVNVWPDPDGRIRWFSRAEVFGSDRLASLASLVASENELARGGFKIDFGIDANQLQQVSVSDVLDGTVAPSQVRGRKVIVGASAVELRDFFDVPRFGLMAGPVVQAMAVESLLQGRALQPLGTAPTLLITALVLLAGCWAGRRLTYGRFISCCAVMAVFVELGAVALQICRPVTIDTAPIQTGLILFGLSAVAFEIVERRVKLGASRRQTDRLRVILDRVVADSFAGIVVVDRAGSVRAASAAATDILGTEMPAGVPYRLALPAPLAALVDRAIEQGRAGLSPAASACELKVVAADRPEITLECVTTVSQLEASSGPASPETDCAVCLTFKDVTAERRVQQRLADMARIDILSGLANRAVYLEAVEASTAADKDHAATILFDIDRFKLVNDRLGHAAGDALIQAMAARLRTLLDPKDVAARLGGDEFALLVRRSSRQEFQILVETLVRDLAGPYDLGNYQPFIVISLGIAFVEGQSTKDLMSSADTAHHAAKAAGGNQARFYDAAMKAVADEQRRLEADLRHALARSEFEVYYQRQVDIATEQIIGVEALLRWTHPERGPISPAVFIPIAERTGLIDPIGSWVLATACRDAARWPVPIKVSVNLSAVQLARSDFAESVFEALTESGLHPTRLDLELTESLLMENDELVRDTLGSLRKAGVKISLDDFGTGYSSLSYLDTFSIDKVKIDQSFVRNLVGNATARAIIRAVVSLARDIGLQVNAEGVETVEQMRLLRQLGCDEVQGYLHGRPQPFPAIEADLMTQRAIAA